MAQGKTVGPLRQRAVDVLRWMVGFHQRMGYMPTLREIQAAFGYGSTNGVRYHLAKLEAMGYLVRPSKTARTMRVTPAGHKAAAA